MRYRGTRDERGDDRRTSTPDGRRATHGTRRAARCLARRTLGFIGDGGPATAARFNFPQSVGVDGSGNLLVADSDNSRIRSVGGQGLARQATAR